MLLVSAEHEVGRRRKNTLDGGQLLGDERGYVAQVAALHLDEQIIAAGHQVTGPHLFVAGNPLGELVETTTALRGDLYLDHRPDYVIPELLIVHHGPITQQDSLGFQAGDLGPDL